MKDEVEDGGGLQDGCVLAIGWRVGVDNYTEMVKNDSNQFGRLEPGTGDRMAGTMDYSDPSFPVSSHYTPFSHPRNKCWKCRITGTSDYTWKKARVAWIPKNNLQHKSTDTMHATPAAQARLQEIRGIKCGCKSNCSKSCGCKGNKIPCSNKCGCKGSVICESVSYARPVKR